MNYIANTDVETFLNITLSADGEAAVDALIPPVEAFAESYCGRKWNRGSANVSETFDGGTDTFFPAHTPIDSVVSVNDDGDALDAGDIYNYGTHIKLAYRTTRNPRSVVITYKSDNPIPADLKHALVRWVADIFKSSEDAGKTAKRATVGPMTVEFLAQDGIPKYVEMVLNRYRAVPI